MTTSTATDERRGSEPADRAPLHVRWLGRVPYDEAWDLQRSLVAGDRNHLLLLEHPAAFTLGRSSDPANILVDPASVGAVVRDVERGGDVTVHAPGQLVGYPILTVPGRGGIGGAADYVHEIEQLLIDTLAALGLAGASRLDGYTGVWLDAGTPNERKIAAIGVKLARRRSMHGFALNVDIDHAWFDRIVPCGIEDKAVTSLAAEGLDVSMRDVVDELVRQVEGRWETGAVDRADVAFDRLDEPEAEEPQGTQPFDAQWPLGEQGAVLGQHGW